MRRFGSRAEDVDPQAVLVAWIVSHVERLPVEEARSGVRAGWLAARVAAGAVPAPRGRIGLVCKIEWEKGKSGCSVPRRVHHRRRPLLLRHGGTEAQRTERRLRIVHAQKVVKAPTARAVDEAELGLD